MLKVWLLLCAGHFLMDFSLQTDFIARGKSPWTKDQIVPWYYILTAHAAVHGLAVGMATGSAALGLAEFACHWLIDLAKCAGMTNIHVDQALHLLCKALWVSMLMAFGQVW